MTPGAPDALDSEELGFLRGLPGPKRMRRGRRAGRDSRPTREANAVLKYWARDSQRYDELDREALEVSGGEAAGEDGKGGGGERGNDGERGGGNDGERGGDVKMRPGQAPLNLASMQAIDEALTQDSNAPQWSPTGPAEPVPSLALDRLDTVTGTPPQLPPLRVTELEELSQMDDFEVSAPPHSSSTASKASPSTALKVVSLLSESLPAPQPLALSGSPRAPPLVLIRPPSESSLPIPPCAVTFPSLPF